MNDSFKKDLRFWPQKTTFLITKIHIIINYFINYLNDVKFVFYGLKTRYGGRKCNFSA